MNDDHATLSQLKRAVESFVSDREWEQFHTPKSLSVAIACEAAELMELFKWECVGAVIMEEEAGRAEAKDELADILIYCLAFANRNDIDLSKAIIGKLRRNCVKYPMEEWKGRAE